MDTTLGGFWSWTTPRIRADLHPTAAPPARRSSGGSFTGWRSRRTLPSWRRTQGQSVGEPGSIARTVTTGATASTTTGIDAETSRGGRPATTRTSVAGASNGTTAENRPAPSTRASTVLAPASMWTGPDMASESFPATWSSGLERYATFPSDGSSSTNESVAGGGGGPLGGSAGRIGSDRSATAATARAATRLAATNAVQGRL